MFKKECKKEGLELKEKFTSYVEEHKVVDLFTDWLGKCVESGISPKKCIFELLKSEVVPDSHSKQGGTSGQGFGANHLEELIPREVSFKKVLNETHGLMQEYLNLHEVNHHNRSGIKLEEPAENIHKPEVKTGSNFPDNLKLDLKVHVKACVKTNPIKQEKTDLPFMAKRKKTKSVTEPMPEPETSSSDSSESEIEMSYMDTSTDVDQNASVSQSKRRKQPIRQVQRRNSKASKYMEAMLTISSTDDE